MTSFEETDIDKLDMIDTIKRTQSQFIRVYPYGLRFQSSNYYPIAWCKGIQLIALNYQTYDEPMIVNIAKFKNNGSCGYLLKTDHFLTGEFLPETSNLTVIIELLEARLNITSSPYITVKLFRDAEAFSVFFLSSEN